jgi:hypothetical protein
VLLEERIVLVDFLLFLERLLANFLVVEKKRSAGNWETDDDSAVDGGLECFWLF